MSLKNAIASSFGARLLMAVLNYGLFWVLAHRLGGSELGGYSLLMNVFYLLQTLPLLGLSTPISRRIATEPQPLDGELAAALNVAAPVTLLLALGCGLAGRWGYPVELHAAFWLLAASMLPTAWTLVAEVALIGREQMGRIARVQALEALLRTVGSVLLMFFGGGLTELFIVFLIGRLFTATVYAYFADLPRPRWTIALPPLNRRNLSDIPVFLGIGVLAALAGKVDVIAVSRLAGLEATGLYAAAARLYEASLMLPTVAALALMPALARLYQQDPQQFRAALSRGLSLCLGMGLALAMAVAAVADPLISWLYAPHLHEAAELLRWMIFGAVLMTMDQLLSSTMMAAHAQREDLRTMALTVLSLGLFLWFGTRQAGALGAAMAIPASLVVRVGWRLRWLHRAHPHPDLLPNLLRIATAAALGVTVLGLTRSQSPWLQWASAWLAYGLSAGFLGLLQPRHAQPLIAWLQRSLGRVTP